MARTSEVSEDAKVVREIVREYNRMPVLRPMVAAIRAFAPLRYYSSYSSLDSNYDSDKHLNIDTGSPQGRRVSAFVRTTGIATPSETRLLARSPNSASVLVEVTAIEGLVPTVDMKFLSVNPAKIDLPDREAYEWATQYGLLSIGQKFKPETEGFDWRFSNLWVFRHTRRQLELGLDPSSPAASEFNRVDGIFLGYLRGSADAKRIRRRDVGIWMTRKLAREATKMTPEAAARLYGAFTSRIHGTS